MIQIKYKTNCLGILLFLLGLLNLRTIQAQSSPNNSSVRVDARLTSLELTNFTYKKHGSDWYLKFLCRGLISLNGTRAAENVLISYDYSYFPNGSIRYKKKKGYGRINISKIIPKKINTFSQVINIKIPAANYPTEEPDSSYFCTDLFTFTARLGRVHNENRIKNNFNTWRGNPCVF